MITIDGEKIVLSDEHGSGTYSIGSPEAFAALSRVWLRSGWDAKYVYTITWLGRPIIQLPEDMFRLQELIWAVGPDVIVETGVAHGGSLVFHAGLCTLRGKGRVIGVDIEIRPQNRAAIEAHPLADLIRLIEGSSIEESTIRRVHAEVRPGERVMVLLDSCHERDHVRRELEAYAPLVSPGSYVVVMDGIMKDVVGAPRTKPDWTWNNPQSAVEGFLSDHAEFQLVEPPFAFNEGHVNQRVTYWPRGILRRLQ